MCGIAGIVECGAGGSRVDVRVLTKMRDTLIHRGPDGSGIFVNPERTVGLAHRRLSIVDLAGGAQPMISTSGCVVVFNGEIYNYPYLRKELEADGARFATNSDTEVLLHLYERKGASFVEALEGMFAFALHDPATGATLLARDPVGEKPLYWTQRGGNLIFGSEIKALLAHPAVSPAVAESQIGPYLSNLVTPGPETLFEGISKLRPGTLMICDSAGVRTTTYFVAPRARQLREVSLAESATTAVEMLERSLNDRLMSDVPVGVLLSGGVDSSALVALLRERGSDMATFSVGYSAADGGDERAEARRVAKHFGTDHYEIEIGAKDGVGFLDSLIHHQDEPIADPVCIPLHFVCKLAAKEGVKVVLAGEGADEVFWGYANYRRMLRAWPAVQLLGSLPQSLRRPVAVAAGRAVGVSASSIEMAVRDGRPLCGHSFLWNGAELRSFMLTDSDDPTAIGWDPSTDASGETSRTRFMFDTQEYEFGVRLPELLLMRIDRFSMANSIEARAPFLAPGLIDYMYGQSLKTKMTTRESKMALRAGLRGLVPDWVLDRPKQGFGAPVNKWMEASLGKLFEAACTPETLGMYFDLDALNQLYREPGRGFGVWPILNFGLWHMKWIEGRDLDFI